MTKIHSKPPKLYNVKITLEMSKMKKKKVFLKTYKMIKILLKPLK